MNYSQRMKDRPNYRRTMKIAQQALLEHKIDSFPIDMFSILETYPNLVVSSFAEMAKKLGVEVDVVKEEMAHSDDGVLSYDKKSEKYILLYNDAPGIFDAHMRFTLAHEYGHFKLGHTKRSQKEEAEANLFARELLMPTFLIAQVKEPHPAFLAEYFHISHTSSQLAVKYLEKCQENQWHQQLQIPIQLKKRMNRALEELLTYYQDGQGERKWHL